MVTHFERNNRPYAQISPSELDIDGIIVSFVDYPEFKDEIQSATVLILPSDLSPEHEGPVFPTSTSGVFDLLNTELGDRAIVNAAVRDEDYVEFDYHSEDIILPILFVAQGVLLPLVIEVLASFLYDCLKRDGGGESEDTVKSEIHVKAKDGTQLMYKYEGPAGTFERTASQHFRDLGLIRDEGGDTSCKLEN